MAKGRNLVLVCASVCAAVCLLRQPAFVPPSAHARRVPSLSMPGAAVLAASVAASAPAFADPIGDAGAKLASAAYPLLKDVDWNSDFFLKKPGNVPPAMWSKAVSKAIVMGTAMDSASLKGGVMAHHTAIQGISRDNLVLSEADFANVIGWIGRMIASVPEATTMDVYNAFSRVVSGSTGVFLMRMVGEPDAKAAYAELMEFANVVKANPVSASTPATPAVIAENLAMLDLPAEKLASLALAFVRDFDWTSELPLVPIPAMSAYDIVKGIDTMLVMGEAMDSKLLQEAAKAHTTALEALPPSLMVTEGQLAAIIKGIGGAIMSVPSEQVMDVYRTMGTVVSPLVVKNLYSVIGNPEHAKLAYESFVDFCNVVKKVHPVL